MNKSCPQKEKMMHWQITGGHGQSKKSWVTGGHGQEGWKSHVGVIVTLWVTDAHGQEKITIKTWAWSGRKLWVTGGHDQGENQESQVGMVRM
jgi:hypothetical protein